MHCVKKVTDDLYWIGGSDRRLALFENVYPIPRGVSYNSYVLLDEKTVLLDTVDASISGLFFENLEYVLNGRTLDYLIVNHMDTFAFVMAPMVHWPEAMVSYDTVDKILFSADGFGTFGAINGNLFADEVNFERDWLDDARRYFINIVGKYGVQVQNLLKKAATLEIKMICPLHGPVWRENLGWFIEKYDTWSSYKPEDQAVMIAYASIYGNTENAAEILASKLADKGVKNIAMYDVSVTDPSVIVSESFRCSHLVFAAPSYNGGIFTKMETVLSELKAHSLQNRTVAIMENGTWAPVAGRQMREIFAGMKNIELLEEGVTIRSAVKEAQEASLEALAEKIASSLQ